jgi:branched-chain amino acid aminotransferase
MIWVKGEILPDDALRIPASDRTFEHGLGLFETLRTWRGRPTLLGAHRARMLKSAEALAIPIDPDHFPDERAVAQLLEAEGLADDRVIRITATGGSHSIGSVVWMRSRRLERPDGKPSVRVALGPWSIDHDDPLARHKTLNYWSRRIALEAASRRGFDETLGRTSGEGYAEGSRTNLFVIRGRELTTPSLDAPILPGVMRGLVLDLARALPCVIREVGGYERPDFEAADEVFLTNSVRGIVPVERAEAAGTGAVFEWPAPGPLTRTLQAALGDRLNPGEDPR